MYPSIVSECVYGKYMHIYFAKRDLFEERLFVAQVRARAFHKHSTRRERSTGFESSWGGGEIISHSCHRTDVTFRLRHSHFYATASIQSALASATRVLRKRYKLRLNHDRAHHGAEARLGGDVTKSGNTAAITLVLKLENIFVISLRRCHELC